MNFIATLPANGALCIGNGAANGAARPAAAAVAPSAPCPPVSPGGHGGPMGVRAHGRVRHPAARNGAANGARYDAETVVYRLEEAGQALLALPATGYSTRLRTSQLDIVRSALEGYGWDNHRNDAGRLRPAMPDAARVTRMDEALGWIPLIPRDRYVLRRIVGARSLVSPATERHLFTWRRLATLLGADHKAVQRWHAQGIGLIVAALNSNGPG
ncbi:DUF6362 family protein [Limobrevibacterium gyesilva]|uniref:DUF6362 family protein n=1 Tax=Limobrevibacterium gyesilva TaxID=2991712 RepID=A0AA41YSR2_9PROT|nr:DUF6362 family protein [Limobrevibacterium gyesilva]MCW3477877.1 DUF6362 family protein [Limobrevibacterium gyesilva]